MLRTWFRVAMTLAMTVFAGCATPPQGGRPVSKVAYITSGDTYFYGATRYGQEMSVFELDGKPVGMPADPLELQPGQHAVKMKCGENISSYLVNMRAGEVYQYSMRSQPGGKGCTAALARVRSSY
jgi:hypothetical protein